MLNPVVCGQAAVKTIPKITFLMGALKIYPQMGVVDCWLAHLLTFTVSVCPFSLNLIRIFLN